MASDERLTFDLTGCARCGGEHDAVEYRPFERPVPDPEGDFTHWAPCPTNGDPILMRIVEVPDENVEAADAD
jgi:hypothetical protein